MNAGVFGNPAPNDDSGRQEAGADSSPQEAQSPEHSQSPQASGPSGDQRVPFDRFKKVNDQRKEHEARVKELEAQLSQLKSQPAVPQSPMSQELDLTSEIQRWESEAVKSWDSDPQRYHEAQRKLTELTTQQTLNATLSHLFQQQEQEQQIAAMQQQQQQFSQRAYTEFPELQDPNSDLYKLAEQEYMSDPSLHNSPSGAYRAAQAARLKLLSQGGNARPQALETGRPAPVQTSADAIKNDLTNALSNAQQRGSVAAFLQKHQPWTDKSKAADL